MGFFKNIGKALNNVFNDIVDTVEDVISDTAGVDIDLNNSKKPPNTATQGNTTIVTDIMPPKPTNNKPKPSKPLKTTTKNTVARSTNNFHTGAIKPKGSKQWWTRNWYKVSAIIASLSLLFVIIKKTLKK